ncbi:MAG: energy transducer TonB [Deltaproteobacteria bacterium]|nr:energy transducer TonB [Deltaproteobacteria bacterium]
MNFRFSLGLSLFIHGLIVGVCLYLIIDDPFFWGGGLTGSNAVVMVELSDWEGEEGQGGVEDRKSKIEDRKEKEVLNVKNTAKKQLPAKDEKVAMNKPGLPAEVLTKAGFGTGNSPTPAGGTGSGFDSVAGQSRAPDVLDLIRQRIIRAKSYPLAARRRGIEGTVKLRFRIGPDGSLQNVAVVASSGSEILDEEAVATVKRATPYPYYEGDISMGLKFDLKE